MAANLLAIFCYFLWVPFAGVQWAVASPKLDRGLRLGLIAGVSVVFGAIIGVAATLTAANPPSASGISFAGNGMLAFPQCFFLCLIAGLITLAIRRAWLGLLMLPILLLTAFGLSWWGLTFAIPPQALPY